jgi:DNA polymerase-3 subunit epsilon
VAHDAGFDRRFLEAEAGRLGLRLPGHRWACSLKLARRVYPGLGSYKLEKIGPALGLEPIESHRAMGDSLRVRQLWLAMADRHALNTGRR